MKRITRVIAFALAVFGVFLSSMFLGTEKVSAEGVSFVSDEDGNFISIPNAYETVGTIKNLGDYGFLNHPEDIFIDENGIIYLADTGNNRVLKLTRQGEVLGEYTQGFDKGFNKPKGVYVHRDGSIWIADTGNFRVVCLDENGADKEVFYKPESALLEESFTFAPEKLYVSQTGYIYVLKGTSMMLMDGQNEFRGYVGAAEVPFNLKRLLIRTFGTKSQIERTMKQEPAAYTNFMIASDGMVYGILANEKTAQIRKLNTVGKNTYPEEPYGFTITMDYKNYITPMFSDISVMNNGIITLTDRNTGLLYQYDQEGNLLAVFGGIGEMKGTYQIPIGIANDSEGRLFILDYSSNTITILEPTTFISMIHNAVTLYGDGRYEEAKEYWEEVLAIDSNYSLAHQGVGKVLYKEGKYHEAMDEYYLADDKEGYSESFSEYRHELFRQYFGLIVFSIFLILYLLWKLLIIAKKKADILAGRIEMGGRLE